MKKKGFTLIEMIGVVLIMGLLTLLILPSIVNQLSAKKEEISQASLKLIYDATDLYVKERESTYTMTTGSTYCITLETLVNDGKLKNTIKDFTTEKEIPLNKVVKVTVNEYEEGEYVLVNSGECESTIVMEK